MNDPTEKRIPIGKLKTHCYQLIEEAQKTNQPLIITRRNSIVAKIISINETSRESILGLMQGKAKLQDDPEENIDPESESKNES